MSIDLNLYGKLEESISTMRFRNECHIKILKAKREIAYSQSIDVFIDSINYNLYENGKANPPIQFYGYAILVFQDSLSLEIPLRFPRQRIWQAYQWEAFRQWQGYVEFIAQRQYHRNTVLQIDAIKGALEIPTVVEVEPDLWKTAFVELPLREIHIECAPNTQFTVEYSQFQPVPFTNPFNEELTVDGKSNQIDGDKDGGLPSEGIQARRNPVDDPWKDNDQPSSIEDIGLNGFEKLSADNLSAQNEGELTPETPVTWVLVFVFNPPNTVDGCGVFRGEGEVRTYAGLYGDSWTFPDCNPRAGLNGFCVYQNGVYKSEAYVCNPVTVTLESITPYRSV